MHVPGYGYGVDEPVWPPCAYWAGDGRIRTPIDDEISRRKSLGELVDDTNQLTVGDLMGLNSVEPTEDE